MATSSQAAVESRKIHAAFQKKGLILAVASGVTFGLFGFFGGIITGDATDLRPDAASLVLMVLAPVIVAAICDTLAAFFLLIYNASTGKFKEIKRTIKSKPGKMIMIGAVAGGPIANAAYLVAIANAGPTYAIPVSAAFPLFGAILSRLMFKEKIIPRVMLGMVLTIIGIIIVSYAPGGAGSGNFILGIILALVAALGWGVEGAISSFGGGLLDPDISINLRQMVSGTVFILVMVPVAGLLSHFGVLPAWGYLLQTVATPKILIVALIAAVIYAVSFLTWYQSFARIGTAKTMALNSTYVFWGILISSIFDPSQLTRNVLIGAVVVLVGAFLVCADPRDFLSKPKTSQEA